jgi:hypothetical protein
MRLKIGILLAIGYPAWFAYWTSAQNVLVFLYAVAGYGLLAAYLLATSKRTASTE